MSQNMPETGQILALFFAIPRADSGAFNCILAIYYVYYYVQ